MKKTNKITTAIRDSFLLASLTVSATVHAQQNSTDTSVSEAEVEKVQVTGSRIKRVELSTPAPVISIDQAEIAKFGNPDLGTILAELPAIGAGSTLLITQ